MKLFFIIRVITLEMSIRFVSNPCGSFLNMNTFILNFTKVREKQVIISCNLTVLNEVVTVSVLVSIQNELRIEFVLRRDWPITHVLQVTKLITFFNQIRSYVNFL